MPKQRNDKEDLAEIREDPFIEVVNVLDVEQLMRIRYRLEKIGRKKMVKLLSEVIKQGQSKGLTSDEHFTVDGTLIEGWASLKSFQQNDQKNTPPGDPGNPTVDFHGEKRSNQTHESTTDPDAKLARKAKGKE